MMQDTIQSAIKKEKEKWIIRLCFAVIISIITTLWLTGNYPATNQDQQLSACWSDATIMINQHYLIANATYQHSIGLEPLTNDNIMQFCSSLIEEGVKFK